MPTTSNPFNGPSPAEVPLPNAPLVRVLSQIRFPEILAVEKKEFVAPFQEEIRSIYPVLRQEQGNSFVLGPQGFTPGKVETAWRFSDTKQVWRVTLTPTFVTLETTKYESRKDFLDRLRVVLDALNKHVQPALADRIGVRYIDRVEGASFEKLPILVRSEVLGLRASSLSKSMLHSIQESTFNFGTFQLLARSAVMPPQVTPDPTVIEPVAGPSWLLDLDMSSTEPIPFECESVVARAAEFAERIYAFFRWATTDEFLNEYGGQA